ncbi:murein DD-endopeptidase MepM [Rodentibacter trehalosifermentans]|uniref:murein DD-endopeptidase MepM n=1 Tax=Rodentibacter trehalosifermentans TaxID=1908263 RepID=UPI000984A9BF|nr:murein DD-endopeptidase MepM [Rodentibacter trehalosifermentans]OOF53452.1 peptidase M23 [Rodentibacter trehalosifermentans]
MQHVKLARDRRKKKSRIKAVIFFISLALIFSGIMLGLKDNAELAPSVQSDLEPEMVDDVQYQSLIPEETVNHTTSPQHTEEDATSYDDELQAQDDEVEEVKPEFDEIDALPQDAQDALTSLLDAADEALRITDQFSHTVVRGDKLSDVLGLSGLDDETANALIAAYPELKNLRAGQQFYWILDKNDQLEYLNWLVSEKEERIYERVAEGKFKRQILEKQSVWKKEVLKGQVKGSFAASLRALGLDSRQISQLSSALQWQVSLQKLKKGTQFAVLVSREYLGDKLTGQGNVEGIHIIADGKSYYAIQASNGRYYNQQGETLGKGFARYPLQRQARISSPFNPSRRHPVTGRVRPHKGVDFSVPTGTPIIAPADGLVEKVAYQAGGAGRYVVLRHGREYQTVYMHLSRPLVRAGQTVKKGERIALSGNTGISTGPHLHYEFHINGRPVNPLTVKLPGGSSGMATAERKQFLVRAKEAIRMLKL